MIKKVKGGYQVVSTKGKNLGGPYKSLVAAKKRLRQGGVLQAPKTLGQKDSAKKEIGNGKKRDAESFREPYDRGYEGLPTAKTGADRNATACLRGCPGSAAGFGEVLVRVRYCGVCRTDLHVVEGELPAKKSAGDSGTPDRRNGSKQEGRATRFPVGSRVGIAWLHKTDGTAPTAARMRKTCATIPNSRDTRLTAVSPNTWLLPNNSCTRFPKAFWTVRPRRFCARESSVSGHYGFPEFSGWQVGILWIWRSGTRSDPGRATLGRGCVRGDAGRASPEIGSRSWGEVVG